MLEESYNKIASYLTENVSTNFIVLTIVLTTATAIVYFIIISYIVTKMDKRYFIRKKLNDTQTSKKHSLRTIKGGTTYAVNIAKILVGICLLILGIVMLVLPGQGLITILMGLSLLPFPGKDKMEQSLLARKSIRSSLNWIRIKANKEPFIFD